MAAALVRAAPAVADPVAARPKTVAAAAPLDAHKLASLTNDPVVGKAARIDGEERRGVVAFTFDDGPNPETTPAVIDALEKYDVPATFFIVTQRITGKHGEPAREVLQRELDAGFLVGSHSVSHKDLKKASTAKLAKEIDASIQTLAVTANRPIGMFRAPYGSLGPAGRGRLKKLGLTEVFWSIDTLDWKAHNQERLREKVVSMIKKDGGGVVLMHDVKPITAKVISEVLDDLEAENCARLADHRDPILPVSLHYFLKDGKTPRELPEAVKQRTEAYRTALPQRCARRAPPAAPSEPAAKHAAREPASPPPIDAAARHAAGEPASPSAR
jgi:peptidoglycan/xylan/chitin deacetylase (PgdA/CDA1 family)